MTSVIVIGHEKSNYTLVERILRQRGMVQPSSARISQMSPHEITKFFQKNDLKGHNKKGQVKLQQISKKNNRGRIRYTNQVAQEINVPVTQNEVPKGTPLWQSLGTDLMLANIRADFWGWSDSEALDVLDYWETINPEVKFVFVYDSPQQLLVDFIQTSQDDVTQEDIESLLLEWSQYNDKLLLAAKKYADQSIVICGQQLKENLSALRPVYEQLEQRLHLPLFSSDAVVLQEEEAKTIDAVIPQYQAWLDLIVEKMLDNQPQIVKLYESLQEEALLPYHVKRESLPSLKALREFKSHTRSIELTSKKLEQFAQALEAEKIQSESLLHAYKDSEERVGILLQKNSELSNSLGLSNDRLNTANAKTGELEYALRQMTANAEQKEKDLFDSRNALQNELNQKTALQEREKQLHDEIDKLQEMVEEYYTQLHPQRPTGAANRVKQQANYKIGQYIVKNTKSIGDVFKLPFRVKQIYQTILALDETKSDESLPPLSEYQDYAEVEKVKHHLSYRLGEKIVTDIEHSSRLGLMYALWKEYLMFKKERK